VRNRKRLIWRRPITIKRVPNIPERQSPTYSPSHRLAKFKIEDVAFGGAGVARSEGKIVFVPLTIDGEEVEAQVIEQKHSFDRAKLRRVLRPSTERVEPLCPYFGRCGGCDYQHISYKHQLELKQHQVSELVKRVGRVTDISVSPVIPSPKTYGFRNRITVHAEEGRIGFFAKNSRNVVDVERCAIAAAGVNEKLKQLRMKGLSDGLHRTLREEGVPLTFTQVNSLVAAELLDYVSTRLKGDVLLDAYCGSGFFAHAFAGRFQKTIGLDWSKHAIANAKAAAGPNEHYICANVADTIEAVLREHHPQTVILDPPADGVESRVCEALGASEAEQLIYVSCDPATLSRDLSRLRPRFEVRSIQPFDMFPQTAQIEVVAVMEGALE
jgi:tRNA/tmRNA/rRNA uracil-C5-methylase (TrmA/RlmC/RlmD family)